MTVRSKRFYSKELGGMTKERDPVVNVLQGNVVKSFLYYSLAMNFITNDGGSRLSDGALRSFAAIPGQEVTYTCVPPGSRPRIALNQ